jgi:glutamate decarboxylase
LKRYADLQPYHTSRTYRPSIICPFGLLTVLANAATRHPIDQLLNLAATHLLPFISSADDAGGKLLVDSLPPKKLESVFNLVLPESEGLGAQGLEETIRKVLRYSVNTWRDGFMDKLYASTDPVGVASDVLLSVLNTNVCVRSGFFRAYAKTFGGCFGG